jgi:hypothetical protein
MKSAAQPTQVAFYSTLTGDAALDALLDGPNDGVFDAIAEESPARKYVLIGEAFETQDSTLGRNGVQVVATVHAYVEDADDQHGNKVVQQIANRVIEVLDGAALAVTGFALVTCEYENSQTLPRDGAWRHVALEFRLLLEES